MRYIYTIYYMIYLIVLGVLNRAVMGLQTRGIRNDEMELHFRTLAGGSYNMDADSFLLDLYAITGRNLITFLRPLPQTSEDMNKHEGNDFIYIQWWNFISRSIYVHWGGGGSNLMLVMFKRYIGEIFQNLNTLCAICIWIKLRV